MQEVGSSFREQICSLSQVSQKNGRNVRSLGFQGQSKRHRQDSRDQKKTAVASGRAGAFALQVCDGGVCYSPVAMRVDHPGYRLQPVPCPFHHELSLIRICSTALFLLAVTSVYFPQAYGFSQIKGNLRESCIFFNSLRVVLKLLSHWRGTSVAPLH